MEREADRPGDPPGTGDGHPDVVVVGAGLSGVGMAGRVLADLPGRGVAVLEARGAIGGTWDLFRYPGVRSDSSMATLGYGRRPWTGTAALASAEEIRDYVRDAAIADGVAPLVRYGHRVLAASWSSATARWTLDVEVADADGAATPLRPDVPDDALDPLVDLRSGFVLRSVHLLPRQGPRAPWRLHQDHVRDLLLLGRSPVEDAGLVLTRRGEPVPLDGRATGERATHERAAS